MIEDGTNKQLRDLYEANKEEFDKGFQEATFWGIEGYSIEKDSGKVRALTLDEVLELKDNLDYEIVSIEDHTAEELMKEFTSHLTPEELEELSKPILTIKDNPEWDEKAWLEFSKQGKIIYSPSNLNR